MTDALSYLRSMVWKWLGPSVDRLAVYPARVVRQDPSTGNVDIIPDSVRAPQLQNVPFRGPPGVTFQVQPGQRVWLQYESQDPATGSTDASQRVWRPVVTLADNGSPTNPPPVIVFNQGTHSVARQGDTATIGWLTGTAPAGGGPVTFAISSTPLPPPALPIKLQAVIDENHVSVKA